MFFYCQLGLEVDNIDMNVLVIPERLEPPPPSNSTSATSTETDIKFKATRSLRVLHAIAMGVPIVNCTWVRDS